MRTNVDCELLGDAYYPVTTEMGFVRAGVGDVARVAVAWLERHGGQGVGWSSTPGEFSTLRSALDSVLPLQRVTPNMYLLLECDGGWTAAFYNLWRPAQFEGFTESIARMLGTSGGVVGSSTDAPKVGGRGLGRYGYRKFMYCRPSPEGQELRWIMVLNDGGRWTISERGAPLPEESPEWYERTRVRDRFDSTALIDLCRSLGLRPYDGSFYHPTQAMLLTRSVALPNDEDVPLSEASASWRT